FGFLFFNLAFSAPPGLFLPSILPDACRCGRAGPAVAYLRTFLEKTGYGPNQHYLGGENFLAWYNSCRGCGVRMRNVCSLLYRNHRMPILPPADMVSVG